METTKNGRWESGKDTLNMQQIPNIKTAPTRIDFHGYIFTLEVKPMQNGSGEFMAVYYDVADPMFIKYGATAEEAKQNLWEWVQKHYPSVKAVI